jgi:broad specificity phosphatase PhoE
MGAEIDRLESARGFFASPLERARETMELVREAMGLPPKPYRLDEALMEIAFGDWEGLTWAEVRARDPESVSARRADKWGFVPPGGESYVMLAERIRLWLAALEGDAFVVSHGGVVRALMTMLAASGPGRRQDSD